MTSRTSETTKHKLIEAAVVALRQVGAAQLITALGTRGIAERAGVSPASLFHHFGSVEAFAEAVVERVFDPDLLHRGETTAQRVDDITSAQLPVESALAMHRSEFERLSSDPELRLRMGVWALGGGMSDRIYRDFLRTIDARIVAALGPMLDSWGREPRPPFDMQSFVALHVALLNGSAIRTLVDPGVMDIETFARSASILTTTSLRIVGDRHTVDDRLAEVNYYPGDAKKVASLSEKRNRTRAVVLDAAAELFGSRGFTRTTMAQIARRAHCSASTLYDLFDSKQGLAVALLQRQVGSRLETRAKTVDASSAQLAEHLTDVAGFIVLHSEHAPAYLSDLVCGARSMNDDPLRAVTAGLVSDMQAVGEITPDLPSEEVADLLLSTLFARVLTRPSEGAAPSVAHVCRVILDGVRTN